MSEAFESINLARELAELKEMGVNVPKVKDKFIESRQYYGKCKYSAAVFVTEYHLKLNYYTALERGDTYVTAMKLYRLLNIGQITKHPKLKMMIVDNIISTLDGNYCCLNKFVF